MKRLCTVIHVTDIAHNTLRLMVLFFDRLCSTQIFKNDRQLRIQISSLMKTALNICSRKTCFLKDFRIRQEIDAGSGLFCPAKFRKKSVLQFDRRNSTFIVVMMYISITAYLDIQISRKCIHNGRSDSMEPTACFISRIVKFTTCMKCRKYQTFRRHPFLMHIHRNSPAIICYRTGTIFFQHHMDLTAVSCQMLIHCVINNLINQMIQSFSRDTSDIHTRTFADCFQSFQNRYAPRIISFLFCHGSFPFFHISIFKHLFYIIHDLSVKSQILFFYDFRAKK